MPSINLRSHISEDGILQLQIPLGLKDSEVEVTVTYREIAPVAKTSEELGWEPGFIEKTYGSCADDPIVIDDRAISEELDDNTK